MTPESVYKQKEVKKTFVPTLTSLDTHKKKRWERIKELTIRTNRSHDVSVNLIEDGTLFRYDTIVKTFIAFKTKEHPTKTGLSIFWIEKEKTEGDGIWTKFPCHSIDLEVKSDPGINNLIETIENLMVLAGIHTLIHLKHSPGTVVSPDVASYNLKNLFSDLYNPSRIMRKAWGIYKEIEDKV